VSALADDFPVFGMSDDEALRASRSHPVVAQIKAAAVPMQRTRTKDGVLGFVPGRRFSPRAADYPTIGEGLLRANEQEVIWQREDEGWPLHPVYGNTGRKPMPWRPRGYSLEELVAQDAERGVAHSPGTEMLLTDTGTPMSTVVVHGDARYGAVRGYEVPSDMSPMRVVLFNATGDYHCHWCLLGGQYRLSMYLLVTCGATLRALATCAGCRTDLDPYFELDWYIVDGHLFDTGCGSDEWL